MLKFDSNIPTDNKSAFGSHNGILHELKMIEFTESYVRRQSSTG